MAPPLPAAAVPARPIDLRTATISIIGFWLFYFAIVTLRAAVMGFEGQFDMVGRRLVVALVGTVLTFGLYAALRPFAGQSLPRKVAAAALLTIPFATLFATFNWAAFYALDPMKPAAATRQKDGTASNGQSRWGEEAEMMMQPHVVIADGAVTWYFFFAAWAALHIALGYAQDVRLAERRAAAFRAAARDAELRALRYQVNPHFLFNTLNSLSTLVMRNRPEEAERMILNLSTFFRTSLTADAADDLALDEEIRLQRLYLDIEAVRFPDRLRIAIDVPPALADACIPGLLLQPVVENAIKHGVSRATRPVTLSIRATSVLPGRLTITVSDDGPATGNADTIAAPFDHAVESTGTGLRNVRARLAARFGDDAGIHWGPLPVEGFAVTIELPLVHHGC